MTSHETTITSKEKSLIDEKILLVLLPFWTPLIPPLGLACLKSFLEPYGCVVKTVDANVENKFREEYDMYFEVLREYIPGDKQTKGNYFYNIGQDVLRNHMMAHLNYEDEAQYIELVKVLVYKTFYCHIEDQVILELNKIISRFYSRLENYVIDLLNKEKPGILGLSVYSGTLPTSMFVFKLTREKYPHIKTVMGGGIFADQLAIGSADLDFFLEKTPYIDKIFVGEGEILFLKFLQGELPESQRVYTLKDINGEILDLALANIPDFSNFELLHYPNLATYTSRGCPFQCSFCSETINWGFYRKKKAKQVVDELKKIHEKYGYQLFLMGDSLLNPVITDIARELLEENVSLYWDSYLRADKPVCNIENTLLWRRAGFYRARLGIESGSPRVLGLMSKQITPQQVKDAVSSLAYAGIKTTTYWVVGHPGETEEDFQMTLDLIESLKDDIYEAMCNPFEYFLTGEVNSREWAKKNKNILLYPEKARDLLVVQTWIMDGKPSRRETFRRVIRFVEHCNKLGIPNPYSINEIFKADERWKRLHENSVPSLVEFKNPDAAVDENKNVEKILYAKNTLKEEINFSF